MQSLKLYVFKTTKRTEYVTEECLKQKLKDVGYTSSLDIQNVKIEDIQNALFIYCRDILDTGLLLLKPTYTDIKSAFEYCYKYRIECDIIDIIFVYDNTYKIVHFKRKAFNPDTIMLKRLSLVMLISVSLVFYSKGKPAEEVADILVLVQVLQIVLQYYIFRVVFRLIQLCMEEFGGGT